MIGAARFGPLPSILSRRPNWAGCFIERLGSKEQLRVQKEIVSSPAPARRWPNGSRQARRRPAGGALAPLSALEWARVASKAALERPGSRPPRSISVVMGNALRLRRTRSTARARRVSGRRSITRAGAHGESPLRLGSGVGRAGGQDAHMGEAKWVLAGGMENMSQGAPRAARRARRHPARPGPQLEDSLFVALRDSYCGCFMAQTSDNLARKYGITRQSQDEFALRSHERANAPTPTAVSPRRRVTVEVEVRQEERDGRAGRPPSSQPPRSTSARCPRRSAPSRSSPPATPRAWSTARACGDRDERRAGEAAQDAARLRARVGGSRRRAGYHGHGPAPRSAK